MQHSHCSYCGAAYPTGVDWPRTCTSCGETTWSNPLPVAVILLPIVDADGQVGLVVVRRAIEPFAGELALPGGFIESGESWQEALVRELREETGLLAVPSDVRLFDVHSSYNGHSLLIFGLLPIRPLETLPACTPNDEVSEWLVLNHAQQLAFPTHTEAMADFFAGLAVVDAATQ